MLWAYNSAPALIAEDEPIPFDTVIAETNDAAKLSEDGESVLISKPGWYLIGIEAVLGNTSTSTAILAGIRLYSEGHEFPASERTFDIPISGSIPVSISIPVYVKPASSGIAKVSWQMTDQATVEAAVLKVYRAS